MPSFDKWLTDVQSDDPVPRVARQALKVRLAAVVHFFGQAARHGKRERMNVEGVHQLRVWTRRSGAALKLFAPVLPRRQAKWLAAKLKEIRGVAGEARDCDILLAGLPTTSKNGLAELAKKILRRRERALGKLTKLHAKLVTRPKLVRQGKKLRQKIGWRGGTKSIRPPFGPWCRQQLAPLGKKFFPLATGKLVGDQALHQTRIAGKRLRYALELSAAAIPARRCQRLCEALSQLQDRLGIVCDRLAGVDRLQGWLAKAEPGPQQRALRAALAAEKKQLAHERRAFARWWTQARQQRLQKMWEQAIGLG
ncbi:MAG: CHAD domain-containing protein [Pirellulaceae bacterium]|nr:CHAD domain-containing protein [Pirellulaceae bacterium]